MKCGILSIAFYGAETWTLGEIDKKYLQSFKIPEKGGKVQLHRSCEK
jgi:hypothetical protein